MSFFNQVLIYLGYDDMNMGNKNKAPWPQLGPKKNDLCFKY